MTFLEARDKMAREWETHPAYLLQGKPQSRATAMLSLVSDVVHEDPSIVSSFGQLYTGGRRADRRQKRERQREVIRRVYASSDQRYGFVSGFLGYLLLKIVVWVFLQWLEYNFSETKASPSDLVSEVTGWHKQAMDYLNSMDFD